VTVVSAPGSLGFFGLPRFASLILSMVSSGYKASCVSGLMPARCTRRSTVRCGKPKAFAISVRVSPSIHIISDCIRKMFEKKAYFERKGLDIMFELCDI